jgi:hypothetical protein
VYSIGDLVDKLVIENIKIFNIRQKLREKDLNDEEYVELNNKMIALNENRSVLGDMLDTKVERVVTGQEKNVLVKNVKTYKDGNDEVQ